MEITKESLVCLANHFSAFHENFFEKKVPSFADPCEKCELRLSKVCNCNNIYHSTAAETKSLVGISPQFCRPAKQ